MIDNAVRDVVTRRAKHCCEYCRIPQSMIPYRTFHVEHIQARQHGGSDDPDNLCLSCDRCNAYKGPNLTSVFAETGNIVPLFHPRQQRWRDHFKLSGALLVALTPVGDVTIRLLNMNDSQRIELREELIALGQNPVGD